MSFILFMMHLRNLLYSFVFLSCVSFSQEKFNDENILDPDKAFVLHAFVSNNQIHASWDIKKGYYLYKKSIFLKLNKLNVEYTITEANEYSQEDKFFGESVVFKDFLRIKSMSKYDLNDATIEIRYQGCAEAKYCYPEIIKIL